ncbi:hypothetical protein NQ314_009203 [Rhamnusium bicolor]|uniref:C2H2-type domain-containing protein n=1 Tax=Rhamnusium bicolor TaxID=1586634 RepID=A0AAV8Y2Y7_9CUCU|nr:hypothetical protein NQ314_009203 [Rhamnusium bicolor]
MDDVYCVLCTNLLKSVEFNLKSTNSKHSHTPLISIVENVTGKLLSNQHSNVCLQCCNLINELDAIELRQIEIRNQIKKYVDFSKQNISVAFKAELTENVISTMDSNIINEINDINLFSCNIVKNNLNNDLLTEVPYLKSGIEFFNSELVDIKLDDCVRNENKIKSDQLDEPTKKKGKRKKNPDKAKPHICHCSKEFRTSGELKNHMKSHNNYRPFICEICGQSYKHKTAFNIHMDMHNGINPFTCIYCSKSFTQKGALVRHVPIHTG